MYKIIKVVNYFNMWNDFEIKTLFEMIERTKKKNQPINFAFKKYAIKTNRNALSVRNYYYKMLCFFQNNIKKACELGIDIDKHKKNNIVKFSNEETKDLVEKIESLKLLGHSTRSACMIISNNNPTLMLRFQNKYRYFVNYKRKEQEKGKCKIIKINEYKRNKKLSDDDIKSLFLGLVRLIKTNALDSVSETLKQENAENKAKLIKALNEISVKQNRIDELIKVNNELFARVKELDDKMNELKNKFLKLKIK